MAYLCTVKRNAQVKKTLFSVVTITTVIIIVALILTSCRAKRSVSTTQHQQSASTSAAETHKADSLWASLLEQTYIKIEYYNQNNLGSSDSTAAAMVTQQGGASILPPQGNIKSIEIIHKQEMQTAQTTKIDSVAVADTFTENSETIEKETAAGHDYGFLVFLAVGAALVLIGFCYIKLR